MSRFKEILPAQPALHIASPTVGRRLGKISLKKIIKKDQSATLQIYSHNTTNWVILSEVSLTSEREASKLYAGEAVPDFGRKRSSEEKVEGIMLYSQIINRELSFGRFEILKALPQ